MTTRDVKYRASTIRNSGDTVNDAVNSWSNAPLILDGATLPVNCFGKIGEELGLRDQYEQTRARTIAELNDGTNALIQNREAIYTAADRYEGSEMKVKTKVDHLRPGIVNDGQDYETEYGWARDT